MKNFDVCVIGGGPGGYVAAIRAGQRGLSTVLIEKQHLGGTCLNIGCIPTKTLIAGAEVYEKALDAAEFGVDITGKIAPNWAKMIGRKEEVIGKLRGGIASLLKSAGVTVLNGTATFLSRKEVMVLSGKDAGEKIRAKNIIVATGSEALVPGFIPRNPRVLTSTELLEIKEIPKTLMILGGGVIGCEFACLFAALGSKVTVVEMLPAILPPVDREVSRVLTSKMKDAGITVMTGEAMSDIKAGKTGVSGKVGDATVKADYLLVSIGRKAVTSELNLGVTGVKTNERGWIPVDEYCRTNVPGIYAIGDIGGRIWLAHLASAMGICAVENICGNSNEFSYDLVPGCIFTKPEIGMLGLTEEQCKEQNINYKVGKFPFAALGKAMAINETDGFCKIIADAETDQVLGIHIIGPHATDLIAEAGPAMLLEITARELGRAIHAHPTLGEAMMEAAHAVHGESAHIPTRRKK
ncbi:MAG: dihydrolipoyl dehydrogenase [Victivallaceae bacterium]|nr:dihydrolipoyl dehydrogenase [Victivallaceae bacterium]NLK84334.1 dihydrolipoyl dehydrogenase [Lentisphaerota bacterium]MDD3116780.1 dihydrolipoyl dehydrogenase [Victivallaceae bacterium]MDD3704403.1 dihydrolipoyl dehydrogenase [Victivallaceae bacterium]MDD4318638.1 dihydrolipoyl dehydrogenase [Victivallaceae bacterium]